MPSSTIRLQHHFNLDQAALFAKLAEHETMNEMYPTKVVRLRDGDTERNGVGSARKLKVLGPLMGTVETVTRFEPDTLIEYKITAGGGPLRDHLGTMRIAAAPGGGSDLDYTIMFDSAIPGLAAAVCAGIKTIVKRGLPKIDSPA